MLLLKTQPAKCWGEAIELFAPSNGDNRSIAIHLANMYIYLAARLLVLGSVQQVLAWKASSARSSRMLVRSEASETLKETSVRSSCNSPQG